MSDDGADLGVSAGRAIRTIIGGADQPQTSEKQTVEQMRASLLEAPLPTDEEIPVTEDSYSEHARRLAGCFLRLIEKGTEPTYASLWEAYKTTWPNASTDFTGFMVGWAVNASRRCAHLPPVQNPAIMEIETQE